MSLRHLVAGSRFSEADNRKKAKEKKAKELAERAKLRYIAGYVETKCGAALQGIEMPA
jgi:hypothetical protein